MHSPLYDYVQNGLVLVPIPEGTKGPRTKGWNEFENCISTPDVEHQGNIGLAHAYSGTCAIDIDDFDYAATWLSERGISLEGLLMADDSVQIVSGSQNRAKLLYRLPANLKPLASKKVKTPSGEDAIDFRCGTEGGKTVQDVLPPSIHPDTGKPYTWNGDWQNIPVIPDKLLNLWREMRPEIKELPSVQIPHTAAGIDLNDLNLPDHVATLIVTGNSKYAKHAERSNPIFGAMKDLIKLGVVDDVILSIMVDPDNSISDKALERGHGDQRAAMRWLAPQLAKAHVKVAEEQASMFTANSELVDQYIFIDTENKYLRVSDKQLIPPQSVNRLHKPTHKGTQDSPAACTVIDESPNKQVASGIGWLPVDDDIIELHGVQYANTYKGVMVEPVPGDVKPWLDLCWHVYGFWTDHILDHWAFTLQNPLKKIRWQILIHGKARTGKTMTTRPMLKILGSAAKSFSPDELNDGWGDGFVGSKFLVFEEVYNPQNKAFFNQIKPKLANDDIERLNVKSQGKVVQPNLYSIIMFTNEPDALHFNEDDDKLLVVEATSERWTKEEYKALSDELDNGSLVNHIYDYLLKRDVSNFSYGVLPVRTDAAKKMSRASLPDYQKAVIEMIEGKRYPFNMSYFTLEDLRKELIDQRYRFGNKGLSDVLHANGYERVRGRKKINGVTQTTPYFWRVTPQNAVTPQTEGDVYTWYMTESKKRKGYEPW